MSLTTEEATAIMTPIAEDYVNTFNSGLFDKMANFYDENSVMVEKNKSCLYGKKDIADSLMKMATELGKCTMKIMNTRYEGVGDYINMFTDFEFHTEKAGVLKGQFLQIWRKSGATYVIYHDEYEIL